MTAETTVETLSDLFEERASGRWKRSWLDSRLQNSFGRDPVSLVSEHPAAPVPEC